MEKLTRTRRKIIEPRTKIETKDETRKQWERIKPKRKNSKRRTLGKTASRAEEARGRGESLSPAV